MTLDPSVVQAEILQYDGAASGSWMGMNAVFVGETKMALSVLQKDAEEYSVSNPPHFKHVLGEANLGLLDDPKHGELKRLMLPAFSAPEVDRYLPQIQALADRYCSEWTSARTVARWDDQIKLFTFEVICSVVGGFDFSRDELLEMSAQFALVVKGLGFPIPVSLFGLTPFGKAMKARKALVARLMREVAACRAGGPSGVPAASGRGSMLRTMVEAKTDGGASLTDKELQDNFVGLLIAGHDTTASSLGFALFHLSQHPAVITKMRQEQREVVAEFGPALTPEALQAMPYCEAVLREAWRLHPIVPVVGRKTKRATALGPYSLGAGQNTFVALNHLQATDPRWVDKVGEMAPTVFNPDRFLTPEGSAQGAQLVFGAGKRSCLGAALAMAEAKVLLATVARRVAFNIDPNGVKIGGFPFPVVQMPTAVVAPLTP